MEHDLLRASEECARLGLTTVQVNTHATGDRASRTVPDVYGDVLKGPREFAAPMPGKLSFILECM